MISPMTDHQQNESHEFILDGRGHRVEVQDQKRVFSPVLLEDSYVDH